MRASASSNGARPASDADIGWRWVAAINRRDADGLVEMADDTIELHPTRLDGGGHVYHGHEGIRRWIADLSDSAYAFVEHATDVRRVASGHG